MKRVVIGKAAKPIGVAPAVLLTNPKYQHNVGQSLRACSCFGVKQLWFTGDRVNLEEGKRIPREERMKDYREVQLIQYDYPFDRFPRGVTPVAIEVREDSELLPDFVHPENPLYVFGPEDGSIHQTFLKYCHRFVKIPIRHCSNLSAAVYMVLYDRMQKSGSYHELAEDRGFALASHWEKDNQDV